MAGPRCSTHAFCDRYCTGNQLACARWTAYQRLADDLVPADLYPHQHDRLKALVVA